MLSVPEYFFLNGALAFIAIDLPKAITLDNRRTFISRYLLDVSIRSLFGRKIYSIEELRLHSVTFHSINAEISIYSLFRWCGFTSFFGK